MIVQMNDREIVFNRIKLEYIKNFGNEYEITMKTKFNSTSKDGINLSSLEIVQFLVYLEDVFQIEFELKFQDMDQLIDYICAKGGGFNETA